MKYRKLGQGAHEAWVRSDAQTLMAPAVSTMTAAVMTQPADVTRAHRLTNDCWKPE
jgi:hypothetical protein